MTYQIELVSVRPTVLAAVRKRTTFEALGATIIKSLDEVYAFLRTAPVKQKGLNVVVYFDDVINIEAGVQVSSEFEPTGTVICSATPAGTAARTIHYGPYSALGEAHEAIRAWCAKNGKTLAGPNWEVYGHWNDDPRKLRTDVYYLLKDQA